MDELKFAPDFSDKETLTDLDRRIIDAIKTLANAKASGLETVPEDKLNQAVDFVEANQARLGEIQNKLLQGNFISNEQAAQAAQAINELKIKGLERQQKKLDGTIKKLTEDIKAGEERIIALRQRYEQALKAKQTAPSPPANPPKPQALAPQPPAPASEPKNQLEQELQSLPEGLRDLYRDVINGTNDNPWQILLDYYNSFDQRGASFNQTLDEIRQFIDNLANRDYYLRAIGPTYDFMNKIIGYKYTDSETTGAIGPTISLQQIRGDDENAQNNIVLTTHHAFPFQLLTPAQFDEYKKTHEIDHKKPRNWIVKIPSEGSAAANAPATPNPFAETTQVSSFAPPGPRHSGPQITHPTTSDFGEEIVENFDQSDAPKIESEETPQLTAEQVLQKRDEFITKYANHPELFQLGAPLPEGVTNFTIERTLSDAEKAGLSGVYKIEQPPTDAYRNIFLPTEPFTTTQGTRMAGVQTMQEGGIEGFYGKLSPDENIAYFHPDEITDEHPLAVLRPSVNNAIEALKMHANSPENTKIKYVSEEQGDAFEIDSNDFTFFHNDEMYTIKETGDVMFSAWDAETYEWGEPRRIEAGGKNG